MMLIPSSSSRPADIYLPIWKSGQPAALDLDVTVISTMQQLTQASAASTPGYALHVGEERKMAAHAEACRSVGVHFVPIVAETLGGWSELAIDIIKESAASKVNAWASLPLTALGTSSSASPSPYGRGMPPYGSAASQPAPPRRGEWNRLTPFILILFKKIIFILIFNFFGCFSLVISVLHCILCIVPYSLYCSLFSVYIVLFSLYCTVFTVLYCIHCIVN